MDPITSGVLTAKPVAEHTAPSPPLCRFAQCYMLELELQSFVILNPSCLIFQDPSANRGAFSLQAEVNWLVLLRG